MTLNSIFQYFVPKDKKFFPLFEEAAKNLIVLAETLHEGVNAPKTERENVFNKVEELEAKIEEITHKTHLELSRNFITPFDREDIHARLSSGIYRINKVMFLIDRPCNLWVTVKKNP